jgi:hypothetical protein
MASMIGSAWSSARLAARISAKRCAARLSNGRTRRECFVLDALATDDQEIPFLAIRQGESAITELGQNRGAEEKVVMSRESSQSLTCRSPPGFMD